MAYEESVMKFTFELAKNGEGYVEPNPLVGAVILKNGKILSTGYHKYFGSPHAEIEAINKIPIKKLKDSELFVNLEPCCHLDKKTPPCIDTISNIKFKHIYISNIDPNPKVFGRSIRLLKNKGYNVKIGILKKEGEWLNRAFFKSITSKIPYIVLKMAISADGKIGIKNKRVKISSNDAIEYNKQQRDKFNAILVGSGTIISDDPILLPKYKKLDVPKTFYRVIISKNPIKFFLKKRVFKTISESYPVIFVTTATNMSGLTYNHSNSLIVLSYPSMSLYRLLNVLYKRFNIGKLLVEGGAKIFQQFFNLKLFDEIHLYKSDKVLNGKNTIKLFYEDFEDKFLSLKLYETKRFSNTLLLKYMSTT